MKRSLIVLLTLTLILILSACAADKADEVSEEQTKEPNTSSKESIPETEGSLDTEDTAVNENNGYDYTCMACGIALDDVAVFCDGCKERTTCYYCEEALGEYDTAYHYECWEEAVGLTEPEATCLCCTAELRDGEDTYCNDCKERTTCFFCEEALGEDEIGYHYSCFEEDLWFGDVEATCWDCGKVLGEDESLYCADCLAA